MTREPADLGFEPPESDGVIPGGRGSCRAGAFSRFSARREPRPPRIVQLA